MAIISFFAGFIFLAGCGGGSDDKKAWMNGENDAGDDEDGGLDSGTGADTDTDTDTDADTDNDTDTDTDTDIDTDTDTDSDSDCDPPCTDKSCCDGTCVDLSTDEENCGTCGNDCGSQTCVKGECVDCTPDCTEPDGGIKECGDNGCGGSCGDCTGAGEVCQVDKCVFCKTRCDGKVCGEDGCGGLCGTCPSGQKCSAGSCVSCTPDCSGRLCGDDDGCGGRCNGACPGGGTCSEGVCSPECEPDCAGKRCGNDGCGGSCGKCLGSDVCTDDESDAVIPTYQCINHETGCADGTREGFTNTTTYPDIASCKGSFSSQSLRVTRTGEWCGNNIGSCTAPEDLCAPGWHICMKNGWPGDLWDRVTTVDCNSPVAGTGSFAAASNPASTIECIFMYPCTCTYSPPYGCSHMVSDYFGSIAVTGCGTGALGWTCSGTNLSTVNAACNAASGLTGVLCCKDPPVTGH